MNFLEEYKKRLTTPENAVKVIKSGDWVDIGMGPTMPEHLLAALAERKDELTDVKLRGYLALKPIPVVECDPNREHFIYNSWYLSGYDRKLWERGLCSFMPMIYRNLPEYYRKQYIKVNVALMSVPPMDKHGYFSFSVNCGAAKAIFESADIVILEINEHLPRVLGGREECIHIKDVDMIVEGEHGELSEIPSVAPTKEDTIIAGLVTEHMVSGSAIQLGIGAMPNVVGKLIAKSDLKDLGIHSEMLADAYVDMYKAGKITNKKKALDKNKSAFSFAVGSKELYELIDDNPGFVTYPVDYINSPDIIGKQDNMISINNCIAMDIYGQISSESSGLRQISGTGGQLDFLTGSFMSKGGKGFICMTSTFTDKNGEMKSRILPKFSEGDIITSPRSQSFYVVTEYGCVNLAGKSTWERAEAIISLAHPLKRDELISAAENQKIWRRTNKR